VIESSNGKGNEKMLDGLNNTHWSAVKDTLSTIEFHLQSTAVFDVLALQENIRIGQRIEKFSVEYKDAGEWKKLVEGTTVGHKRLLRFAPVRSAAVRIIIESSRTNATLAEVGLYKQP
jgi:alpha-L-fucosidase